VHLDIIKVGTQMGECSRKSYRKSGDVVPKFIKYTYAIISCSTGNQAIHPSTPHTYRFRISQSFEISSTVPVDLDLLQSYGSIKFHDILPQFIAGLAQLFTSLPVSCI
jgi:hypothetical protein